ncbi:c-type cytochrome [Erwiniaceae bacterium CAU 1747]
MMKSLITTLLLMAACSAAASDPQPDPALIARGRYLAVAADCGACHRQTVSNGAPFAGGSVIASPMGRIVASNITPSKQFGIGNYSEQQFADALRKGIASDSSNLYPAMPYTAYRGMTDADTHALYAYLMHGVEPYDRAPAENTALAFPFNIRQLMWGWNLLYRDNPPFEPQSGLSAQLNRGKYLVDVLAHCSTCHTPRNMMMAEDNHRYLSGGPLEGWYAPNITPDKSGIGDWSQQDLVTYLKTGHLAGKAQAAGPMGEAVEHSFRYLKDDDLQAIAAWIKQVPAQSGPLARVGSVPALVDINATVGGQGDQASLANSVSTDGATLYSAACSSCHGQTGEGTKDNFYPSLTHNSAVSAATPDNLVMTVVEGIHRQGSDADVSMPAFAAQLNNAQIASVTHYVRSHFAGISQPVTAEDVSQIRNGGEPPFIMRYKNGFMAACALLLVLIVLLRWRRKR